MVNVKFELPDFTVEEAKHFAKDLYGISGSMERLPSERDQNFHLHSETGEEYVLKIANVADDRAVLELQNDAMERLAQTALQIPRLCATKSGETIGVVQNAEGRKHFIRMLTYIPGRLLASVKPHSPNLLRSLGHALGKIDQALRDFHHPASKRELKWDLTRAGWIAEYTRYIQKQDRRRLVERFLSHYEEKVAPVLSGLRQSVIYNDANDYNILVSNGEVIGVIDFGDMIYSHTITDLAVCIAYAILGKPDPLTAAAQITAGYHEVFPLTDDELAVLFPLICARLWISVTNAAYQREVEPDNPYLTISEEPAWSALERLASINPRLAYFRFRQACGLTPVPHSASILNWLQSHSHQIGPLIEANHFTEIDLSVGNTNFGTLQDLCDTPLLTKNIFDRVPSGSIGVGGYNVARVLSRSNAFRTDGNEGPEWRTIHLGLDLFAEPGTRVLAPIDGIVHSFRNNSAANDYGPTIVLQHEASGKTFFTLYGHLNEVSLNGLEEGKFIAKGDDLGKIGTSAINGGWPPHVHFQIILDMLDLKGDFPGNALPSQRDFWLQLCPDPNLVARIPVSTSRKMSADEILRLRSERIGKATTISYKKPLQIVRGWMQHLYNEDGRAYLDCVNNVAHVGHCHPRVVQAGQQQMATLNTNSRYLHENLVLYSSRLCETLPENLRVCFFVNSGSEANELALRLARTHTNRNEFLVLDAAYHGHTNALIDISSYKFDGPAGKGAPAHVHKMPIPDLYRGEFKKNDPHAAEKYAAYVARAMNEKIAAFICETLPSCGGQIILPQGYLRDAYRHVRELGGVCIADEVQVGFGRIGSHFWAFEAQDVVPDIVTLGKPIGNGHPMAAVITTPEIASSFANGMEFFSTFGGNPVSCAIGLAVLDVIEEEHLQQNALQVGSYLLERLQAPHRKHGLIGDVRGQGLFIGIELVEDRSTLKPAAAQASYIINRMKEHAILLSTDGPYHNVIKIKPPLVFTKADADFLVDTLDLVLQEDALN